MKLPGVPSSVKAQRQPLHDALDLIHLQAAVLLAVALDLERRCPFFDGRNNFTTGEMGKDKLLNTLEEAHSRCGNATALWCQEGRGDRELIDINDGLAEAPTVAKGKTIS